ncbi:MAG: hypothetical protein FD149_1856 [Rhodospirillaceae bacterium]|nr:MAG: hypothetical protein FD149_1856 [Rhodospirillaceae bacterium]
MSNRTSFVIYGLTSENRWQLDAQTPSESEARAYAENMVAAAQHGGVKIIREWHHTNGSITEKEIFHVSTPQTGKKKIVVHPIDEAPDCTKPGGSVRSSGPHDHRSPAAALFR